MPYPSAVADTAHRHKAWTRAKNSALGIKRGLRIGGARYCIVSLPAGLLTALTPTHVHTCTRRVYGRNNNQKRRSTIFGHAKIGPTRKRVSRVIPNALLSSQISTTPSTVVPKWCFHRKTGPKKHHQNNTTNNAPTSTNTRKNAFCKTHQKHHQKIQTRRSSHTKNTNMQVTSPNTHQHGGGDTLTSRNGRCLRPTPASLPEDFSVEVSRLGLLFS